jgi:hypothetical protein
MLAIGEGLDRRDRLTRNDMSIEREKCEEDGYIRDARVRFEEREEAQHSSNNEQRLASDAKSQPADIGSEMQPENSQEEFAEWVEDFYQEIPPETGVWC